MSIRALALELYRAQKKVAELQKAIAAVGHGVSDKLSQELREAEKEMSMLRKMLDGEIESGEFRKRFSRFGGRNGYE
jgi:Ni,Fe-hydrogenase III large subunit